MKPVAEKDWTGGDYVPAAVVDKNKWSDAAISYATEDGDGLGIESLAFFTLESGRGAVLEHLPEAPSPINNSVIILCANDAQTIKQDLKEVCQSLGIPADALRWKSPLVAEAPAPKKAPKPPGPRF